MALPCTYQRCHQGQRHIFKTNLRKGLSRRLDDIAVPRTWLATTTKSLVLEHFDAFTLVYDHKPVAIEIKGSQMSRAALSTIPRLDKQLIQSRVQKEFGQAVRYAEMQDVPHWSMNQHEHRRELTNIIHEATEGVASTKIKPRKPYATDAILDSAHRARLIKTKHREEQQVKRRDRQRVFAV